MKPFPHYINHRNNLLFGGLTAIILFIIKAPVVLFVLAFVFITTIAYFGSTQISSNYHLKTTCSVPGIKRKEFSITFDDGFINPENSKKVLAILDKYNVKATFFCIAKNLKTPEQVDILKQVYRSGHIIGNHSYGHSWGYDFYSTNKIYSDTEKADEVIYNHIGVRPNFYRPPYGITTPNIARAINKLPHSTIGWSLRSLDTVIKRPEMLLNRVKAKLKDGDIILFHDHVEYIPDFLILFMEYILKEGYAIIPLDELTGLNPYQKK